MLVFSILAILITGGLVNLIIFKVQQSKSPSNLSIPDNPLLLTIQAMENELAELHENNIHMKRIAQLEKDIEEAKKHAEALSKVAGNYGGTMEEVGESIVGGIGGRNAIRTVAPVDSNGIVVGGLLSKGLVIEKPEEVGEPMQHSTPNSQKLDNGRTRQYIASYRTYTRQAGWSSYHDVKFK